ncbi:unnamed protein product [Darwinula stevensoni]|uniref:Uncharacterized protein n=1 Tax=Darwinula stevensoni TaxID=69355 RepID=A0A7R8XMD7_9CRUS|nr:unnamed protein product [Darwinula stevensoni]CAG0895481.1 unnamed protein product [Darwinula stevensoni]
MKETVWVKRENPMQGSTRVPSRNSLEIAYSDVHYWVRDHNGSTSNSEKSVDEASAEGEHV